jgi:omega-6 fatty acid desaturase (delta-12 desaturase)
MYWAIDNDAWHIYAMLVLPAAGLLVRLFMIQHDCAHRSFVSSRRANDWIGRVIGIATLTPHDHWRATHSVHHAGSGNLDRRGIGDVYTLTAAEYLRSTSWARRRYRLYRHPVVLFGLGPLFLFVVHNRLPMGSMRKGWRPWLSTMGTNGAVAAMLAAMIAAFGVPAVFWIYLPTVLIAATAGVWLFFVQHQFENTHWAEGDAWNANEAAFYGSSHYELPAVLRWFTANIGMHNIHHLASRIPFYRLPEVLRDHEQLRGVGRVTLRQSLRGIRLALWDEEQQRLITFEQLRLSSGTGLGRERAPRAAFAAYESAQAGKSSRPIFHSTRPAS